MSLIVETGTGLSNAESYISVADATAYLTAFGPNAGWTVATTDAKEIALRVATQYLDAKYNFRGFKNSVSQVLAWPRADVYIDEGYVLASNSIPECLRRATVEAAIRHIAGDLLLGVQDKPGLIANESVKVGPIETSKTYVVGRSPVKLYPKITALLKNILNQADTVQRS